MARRGFLPDLGRSTVPDRDVLESKSIDLADQMTGRKSLAFAAAPVRAGEAYRDGWDVDRAIDRAMQRVVWVFKAVDAKAKNHAKLRCVMRIGDPEKGEETTSPIADLLNGFPNPYQDAWSWRYMLSSQVDLSRKGAFVEIVRSNVGDPIELYLLPPARTFPIPDPTTYVSGFRVTLEGGRYRDIAPEDVCWIGLPHPTNPYQRMTPLEAAGLSVEIDYYARLWNRNFMQNDGRPGGIFAVGEAMDDDDVDELNATMFTPGPAGAGRVRIIDDVGKDGAQFIDLSVNPRDAQYEKSRQMAKDEVLIAFGTPESVLGNASGRTFDNADAEKETFWEETEQPHNSMLGRGLHRLDPDPTHFIGWDYSDIPVLGRAQRQREAYKLEELTAHAIGVDEYREETGRPPIGDEVLRTQVGEDAAPVVVSGLPAQAGTPARPAQEEQNGGEKALETQDDRWNVRYGDLIVDSKVADTLRADASRRIRRWERSVKAQMVRFFKRQETRTVARLTGQKVRMMIEPPPPEARNAATWQRKAVDAGDVFDSDTWNEQLTEDAKAWLEAVIEDFGDDVAERLGVSFDLHDSKVTDRIEQQVNRIKGVNETTFKALSATLAEGEEKGETIDELAARVKGVFEDASSSRAETIARTEVVSAANSASVEAGAQAGVEKKVWLATDDERTRDEHLDADGQVVAMDDVFNVDGEGLEYPGDPQGSPENVINCRCTVVFDTGNVVT